MGKNKGKTGGKARAATPRHRNPSSGSYSKSPRTPRGGGWTSDEDTIGTPGFTLRDAAKAREPGSFRGNNGPTTFRHQSIGFVRSTDPPKVDPEEQEVQEVREEQEGTLDEAPYTTEGSGYEAVQTPQSGSPMEVERTRQSVPEVASLPQPAIEQQPSRPSSPAGSESGEEVVLFRGRAPGVPPPATVPTPQLSAAAPAFTPKAPTPAQKTLPQTASLPQAVTPVPNIDTPVATKTSSRKESKSASKPKQKKQDAAQIIADLLEAEDVDEETFAKNDPSAWEDYKDAEWISEDGLAELAKQPIKNSVKNKKSARMPATTSRPSKRSRMSRNDAAIEAAIADYIENTQANSDDSDEMADVDTSAAGRDGWNSSDLEDFDELSTSEEILEEVELVLSKRERPSGLQYLIVWEGQSVDEARWIPNDQLTMKGALELIAAFEEEEKNAPEYEGYEDEDSDDDDDDDDEDDDSDEVDSQDDEEAFLDEMDLIERRQAQISDEKLARLLAKQEALGLGSDELMLFDQAFAEVDATDLSDDFMPFKQSKRIKKGGKGGKSSKANLKRLNDDLEDMDIDISDDDAMFGDNDNANFNSFDITDRSRASISRSAKDRKNDPLTWGLSDSDQAADLRNAWQADRAKKAAKKQEREEMRAAGMLGKKNKFKPDLKARYNEGMSVRQLGSELEDFLLNDDMQSRALPPMDKRDRKTVHEIASMFGLKSLSKGSGKLRFPVLQKTGKTIDYDTMLFTRLLNQVERRFLGRMDKKGKSPRGAGGPPPRRQGGINSRADVGYREGDVVGANAPEISAENRGRAMLEKMGWSTGMALGGKDSKGILQPISHVIKHGRAGL